MKRIATRLLVLTASVILVGCDSYYLSGAGSSGAYSGGGYINYGAYGPGPGYCPPKHKHRLRHHQHRGGYGYGGHHGYHRGGRGHRCK